VIRLKESEAYTAQAEEGLGPCTLEAWQGCHSQSPHQRVLHHCAHLSLDAIKTHTHGMHGNTQT